MTETARIRWEDSLIAPGDPAFQGHVDELDDVFRIWPPEEPGDESMLTTWLPGLAERQLYGFPLDLKREAERWLEEFVTSLGAVFAAEPPMVCTACRKPVRKVPGTWAASVWDHADAGDGRACPNLGAHLTGTPIMGMPAEPVNPAPAGEE